MSTTSTTRLNDIHSPTQMPTPVPLRADEVPAGWSRKHLGVLLDEVDERADALAAHEHDALVVYSLTKRFGLIPQSARFTHRVATEDTSKYKVVRKSQIVYNPYVIWEGAVHALKIAETALVSPVYVVWCTKEPDGGYLDLLLRSPEVIASYQRLSSGAVNRRRSIRKEGFLSIEVMVPPLEERRAIAAVFDRVEEAIGASERVVAATRQLQAALRTQLFTYGPVPVGEQGAVLLKDTGIGALPSHWDVARLGDLAQVISGGTPSKAREEFWTGPIPWVSPKDLKCARLYDAQDHVSADAVEQGSRLAPAKTIFLVVRGMILARDIPITLGMVPMAFNQDLKGIIARERVTPDYLLHALMLQKRLLMTDIGSSAHGTRRIGSSAVENLLVPVPPPEEQSQIASALEAADLKLAREEARLQALERTRASLLRDMTSGARRLPEFADAT